jgi:endonuclease/exonuclease/phosphatase family metal-dependent hydrolase
VEACRSLDADVLCLQEADRGQARSGGVDQTAEIARGMGSAAWRFAPALIGEPGGAWRAATDDDTEAAADQPGYGVAIVARRPVQAWHVVRLKAAPVKAPVAVPGGKGRFIVLPDEPRAGLVADLGDLLVATTHLSFVPGYNLVQLRRLTTALAALAGPGRPCLVAGDLNAPGALPRWASGWRALAAGVKTYPADRPRLQVDHVLARPGPHHQVVAIEARRTPISDHRALVLTLGSGGWP